MPGTPEKAKIPLRNEPPQIVRTAQKKAPNVGLYNSSNELAPQLQRCQFCFGLNALMVIEEDVVANERASVLKGGNLLSVDAFCFENREEVFSQSIVVGIPAS